MRDTSPNFTPDSLIRRIVRWGLYPASWAALLFGFHRIIGWGHDPRMVWGQTVGALAAVYLVTEITLPYQARWAMTWASLYADLKFVIFNAASVAAISASLALMTITIAGDHPGPATGWPIPAQLAACFLIFEAVNYTLHRAMHRLRGPVGRFLWRSHAAHHLPPRLYLVMHAVFHPVNAVLIQGVAITLPIWAMGYGPVPVAMFLMINGMHGLISHFNVDVRAGWANYLFVGTELHRYHHSADVTEAGNFGATLSVFDQLFSTFVYRPGVPPAELGTDPASGLPRYERFGAVMALPFHSPRAAEQGSVA
jgi:sterol desaturase/sphingolipid hydroxylase (fatty acid hydroxylase superfamily)